MNKKLFVIGLLLSGVISAPVSHACIKTTVSGEVGGQVICADDGLGVVGVQGSTTTVASNNFNASITSANFGATTNYQSNCSTGNCGTISRSSTCKTGGCSRYRKPCMTGNRIRNYGERYVVPYGVPETPIKLPSHLCGTKDCLANRGFHRLLNLVRCREITCKSRCQVYQQDEDHVIAKRNLGGCNCLVGTCNEDLFGNR